MSDPVTWTVALTALGTGVAAVGAIRQGQAQAAAMDFNAKVAQQNADIAEGQSLAASEAQQRDAQRRIGASVAAYGASGVQMSEGSPSDVLAESARMAALDNLTLKYNYKLKGLGYQTQSQLDSANAASSRTASYFNAAATTLSGGSKLAGYFA